MFKFIKWFVLMVGLICLNNHSILAQTITHPDITMSVSTTFSGPQPGYISYTILDGDNKSVTTTFDFDAGIKSITGTGSYTTSTSCSYTLNQLFSATKSFLLTPYGTNYYSYSTSCSGTGCWCPPASVGLTVSANRKNNTITISTPSPAFDEPASFSSINFYSDLNEYLHIEIYNNSACTGTPVATFNLGVGVTTFILKDKAPSVYQSLTNKTSFLKVSYLSATIPYASSAPVIGLPIFFADKVDISGSISAGYITFPNVICKGDSTGSVNISKIKLVFSSDIINVTNLRYVVSKELWDNNNKKYIWIAIAPTASGGIQPDTTTNNAGGMSLTTVTKLKAGHYKLKIWGTNIGVGWYEFTIAEPSSKLTYDKITQPPTCLGDNNGSITVSPKDGWTSSYTIIPATITSKPAGNYTFTITDAGGCILSGSESIPNGLRPAISVDPVTLPACSNYQNGAIPVIIQNNGNNTADGDIFWLYKSKDGQTDSAKTTLPVKNLTFTKPDFNVDKGSYQVYIRDKYRCKSEESTVTISDYNNPIKINSINAISKKTINGTPYHLLCNGDTDGQITVDASVTPSVGSINEYSLENTSISSTSNIITGVPAGIAYHVVVSIDKGCTLTSTSTVDINGPSQKLSFTPSAKTYTNGYNISCHDNTKNGEITITNASGGVPDYQFSNDGTHYQISPVFSDLNGGLQTFYMKDALGCPKITSLTLSKPDIYTVNIDKSNFNGSNVSCNSRNDGSISISSVTGGAVSPLQYKLDSDPVYDNFNTRSGFTAGVNYSISVKDNLGCVTTQPFTITQPAILSVTLTPLLYNGSHHVSCHGSTDGQIQATIGGGTPNYSAYLFHKNDEPALDYSNAIDSRTNLTSTSSAPNFSGLAIGDYKVALIDANGCSTIQPVSLTDEPASLGISDVMAKYKAGSVYHISCNGATDGQIDVSISGGTLPYTVFLKEKTIGSIPIQKTITSGSSVTFGDNLLGAGEYQLRVVDANGCQYPINGSYEDTKYLLTEPQPIAVSLPLPEHNGYYVPCHGDVISLTPSLVSGGNGAYNENNYSYTWSNGQSSKTASGLGIGVISLTVTDNKNCPSAIASVTINQPEPLYFTSPLITKPSCTYSSNGQIEISATGGVPSYIFNIGPDIQYTTPALFDTLTDGAYTIHLEDYNGCTNDTLVKVLDYPALSLSVTNKSIPHCYGGSDGWLQISGSLGNPINGSDYKFRLFSNGNQIDSIVGTTALFDTLTSGSYTVTIMDDFGCIEETTPTINDAAAITFTTKIDTNKCFNDNTAQLTIKATSGYGGFMFAYRFGNDTLGYTLKPDSTLTLSGLNWNQYSTAAPLPYHIYIRDANYTAGQPACSVHDQVLLPMVKKMFPHVVSSPISCLGTPDGSMSVGQTENAQGAISYSWLGPKDGIESVTSNAISGLAPGIYTVTVKDSHSCEFSDSRTFTSPQPISVTVMNTIPESGDGHNDGKAFFEVTGTHDTISYWIDGGLTQTAILDNSSFKVEPLSVGSHTIAIANPSNINCKASTSFVIKHQAPSLLLSSKLNATSGGTNGMISVTASGGAGNFSYIWLNHAGDTLKQYTTSVTTTLGKGIYSVVAMDSEGNLSNIVTDTIIESDKLSIALMNQSSPTCRSAANGLARVSAGGGYRPYTYWWVNANGVKVSSDSIAINLLPGNYTAYVSDNRDTVNILTTLSPVNPIKDINLLTAQPTCHNQASGQIQISSIQGGSGNFSYQWSTGATSKDLDNLAPGSYTVTVVDNAASGQVCSFTKPVVISSGPAALALRTDSVISPVCYDGTDGKIYVSALGGTSTYSITWPGTMAKGAAYYNAAAGKHAVLVTDAYGCQLTDTINVENPLPLQFDQTLTQPKCIGDNNGSISLMMLNGRPSYSAKWTPELYTNSLLVNVPAGSYTAEITDANGCKVNGSFTILSPKPLKVDSFLVTSPGCSNTANGALTAQVSGGTAPYVYKWSNYQKGQTATALVGGKYNVTVTDNNLCQASGQVELTTPAPLAFNVDVQEPSCSGYANGSLVVTPQGGTGAYSCTVNLQPSELTVPDLYAGRYNIVVKDINNCAASKNVWVSEPTPMVAVESILSTITCANLCNGQAKLDVSGSFAPYSASWDDSGNGLERNDLCAGTFQVQITDSHGCQISKFVSMEQPDAITVDNIEVVDPTCTGGSNGNAAIVCSGGTQPYAISWDNGQSGNTAQGLSAATYMVTIADANNCSISKNIAVEDPAKETITAFPSEFKLCEGQKNEINPGAWATYAWYLNNTKVSDTSRFNANQTGNYKLSVVSEKGCSDSTEFSVLVSKDLLSAKFLIPNDVVTDDTVTIVDVSWPVPDSISWRIDSEGAQVIKLLADRQQLVFKNPGEYSIKLVAHKALCVSEVEQTITVYNSPGEKTDGKQPIKPPSDIEELYLFPNPSNGAFTVKVKLAGISKVSLKIIKMAENKLIAEKESENSDLFEVPFDLPGIAPGVYMLNVQTETSQKNVKFVIMN